LEYLLFAGYLILISWLVTRIGFFRKSGLSKAQLVILLLIKVMAGIFYGWIGIYYGQYAYMFDTWGYHYASLDEYHLLLHHPGEFFTNLFEHHYQDGPGGFFSSENSWWNDLKTNLLIKVLSVFDVLSFGNYYINVIFYSLISLFGPVAIFRIMNEVYPGKRIQVLMATFLIPSFIYWTSGIHKDGLVFLAVALIIYQFYQGLKETRFRIKRILIMLLSFLILLSFRNFILLLMLPALIAWYFANKYPRKALHSFIFTYLLFIIIFFTLRYIFPTLDFPQAVVNKQQAFEKLQGNSSIDPVRLSPDLISFVKNFPKALSITMLRPYPGDVKHLLSLAAAAETLVLLILFLMFLFWRINGVRISPFSMFCLFFSITVLLSIGYTVNFLGAIVRYRSIIIPLLMIPVISHIDWKRIFPVLVNNIK